MNRREVLSALAGVGTAIGVEAEAGLIEADPKPLLLVLRVGGWLTIELETALCEKWEALREANPSIPPLVVLQQGQTLEAILDPRAKQ